MDEHTAPVLILAPSGRDAAVAAAILGSDGKAGGNADVSPPRVKKALRAVCAVKAVARHSTVLLERRPFRAAFSSMFVLIKRKTWRRRFEEQSDTWRAAEGLHAPLLHAPTGPSRGDPDNDVTRPVAERSVDHRGQPAPQPRSRRHSPSS